MATMSKAGSRSFEEPDEQAEKGGVKIDIVYLGDLKVKRANYPAGWRFSEKMGADHCGDTHVGYVIDGLMHVKLNDGSTFDTRAGDAFVVPANHDAWTEDGCTIVQFDEFDSAAQRFGV